MDAKFQAQAEKPHAVCIPFPAQGLIAPMLHLAKLIHSHGFHITFVNTEYNHNRFLSSQGPAALLPADDFNFTTIPDGLPHSGELNVTQDIPSLCASTSTTCLSPLLHLIHKLNQNKPTVSCIVSSGFMTFSVDAAKELAIPVVSLWTTSACGFMSYLHFQQLFKDGLIPLKDEGKLSDGYLDTPVRSVPGMKDMRLRDFPTVIRTTNPNDILLNFAETEAQRATQGSAIIINTFEELEPTVLNALRSMLTIPIYTIGPLFLLSKHNVPSGPVSSLSSNLWKEDTTCLDWLDKKGKASVLYVNFGSITVLSKNQLVEFAWGLANSKCEFLWVLRSDLVKEKNYSGDDMEEFLEETRERGLVVSWCPQEVVLEHAAVGGFLTHSGWNSTLESLSGGVPMISWPFFAEQPTNCRFACNEWGVGMEIGSGVERGEVEKVVREMMGGEKGWEMRKKAMEWKELALKACEIGGQSLVNLESVVKEVMLPNHCNRAS
ncbi:UDP-glucuronosyl/UDP-glucosyltransferase protein [Dioscorea alata]|uniref:UDP-glucuronosyl/UDP-glucosyltransferase protein n=2 Tax=Dioscorea alata TaxID=55571 RepID=A0ACB7TV02_DIOAL|nr:UDP-glucuronosyl/UDP-glucosyltransferase protein [Dioscorea alata]